VKGWKEGAWRTNDEESQQPLMDAGCRNGVDAQLLRVSNLTPYALIVLLFLAHRFFKRQVVCELHAFPSFMCVCVCFSP
jgi:hypothetical protein